MRIFATTDIGKDALDRLRGKGYDLEVYPAHTHLGSGYLLILSGEKRVRSIHADDHNVRALQVVIFGDEASFFDRDVGNAGVVRRHSLRVTPAIIMSLIRNVVVEGTAAVADIRSHLAQYQNQRCSSYIPLELLPLAIILSPCRFTNFIARSANGIVKCWCARPIGRGRGARIAIQLN